VKLSVHRRGRCVVATSGLCGGRPPPARRPPRDCPTQPRGPCRCCQTLPSFAPPSPLFFSSSCLVTLPPPLRCARFLPAAMATSAAADAAEATLRSLAEDLTALEAEVAPLRTAAKSGGVGDEKEFRAQCSILSERLTQFIIRIDSVEVRWRCGLSRAGVPPPVGRGRAAALLVGRGSFVYKRGGWDGAFRLSLHGGMRVVLVLADRCAVARLARSLLDAFGLGFRASMHPLVVTTGAESGASI